MFTFRGWTLIRAGKLWRDPVSPGSEESPEAEGTSLLLLQTCTGSIKPAPPYIKHFLPTGCTIRSLLSGLGSGGCVGSGEWALSHWIMPLFQLLWPGMPNFTARYSSLCVNQSFARGRGAHMGPPPAPCESDPSQTVSHNTTYSSYSHIHSYRQLLQSLIFLN